MTMYYNASSTGSPAAVATNSGISLSQVTFMLLVLPWFVVSPTNLNGGIFTNRMGFSAPILSSVNITNGGWSLPFFNSANCADKDTYVYDFCTKISLQAFVAFFNCGSMSHSHIIISGLFHINNWHCISLYHNMFTTVDSRVSQTLRHGTSLHRICPKLLIDSSPSQLNPIESSPSRL